MFFLSLPLIGEKILTATVIHAAKKILSSDD